MKNNQVPSSIKTLVKQYLDLIRLYSDLEQKLVECLCSSQVPQWDLWLAH